MKQEPGEERSGCFCEVCCLPLGGIRAAITTAALFLALCSARLSQNHPDAVHDLPERLAGGRLQDNDGSCPVHCLGFPEELGDSLGVGLVQDQLLLHFLEPENVFLRDGPVGHSHLVSEDLGDGEGHRLLLEIGSL